MIQNGRSFKEKRSYPVDALKSLFDDVYGRISMRKLTLSRFAMLSRPLWPPHLSHCRLDRQSRKVEFARIFSSLRRDHRDSRDRGCNSSSHSIIMPAISPALALERALRMPWTLAAVCMSVFRALESWVRKDARTRNIPFSTASWRRRHLSTCGKTR